MSSRNSGARPSSSGSYRADESTEIETTEGGEIPLGQKTSALEACFSMVERIDGSLKSYPAQHTKPKELARKAVERFSPVLEACESLEVSIGAERVETNWGEVVASAETMTGDKFLWYRFFASGVLKLRFEAGFDAETMLEFVEVVHKVAHSSFQAEEDAATLLWERDLPNFEYLAIDSFLTGGTTGDVFGDHTPREVRDKIADAVEEPEGASDGDIEDIFESAGVVGLSHVADERMASIESSSLETSREDSRRTLEITHDALEALIGEWESGARIEYRFVEALLRIVEYGESEEVRARACDVLLEIGSDLFERQQYETLSDLFVLLEERRDELEHFEFDLADQLRGEFSNEVEVQTLVATMLREERYRESIAGLLPHLESKPVQEQILQILGYQETDDADADLLFDILTRTATTDDPEVLLADDRANNPDYLRRLLAVMEGRDLQSWPPAHHVLGAALSSGQINLQLRALDLEFRGWTPERAREHLVPVMESSDHKKVRRRVAAVLQRVAPEAFGTIVESLIENRRLKRRPRGEVRFLLNNYLQTDFGESSELYPLVDVKGWFSEGVCKVAVVAAQVLVAQGDRRGRELVETRSRSMLTAPNLRRSLEDLLERYEG